MTIPDDAVQAALTKWYEMPSTGDSSSQKRDMRAALTSALPFLQGVKVKELEWEYNDRPVRTYQVFDCRGTVYYIDQGFGSDSFYFTTIRASDGFRLYDGDDLPSAKAAAQADYSARILSEIETGITVSAPSQRVQALEEEEFAIDKLRFRAFHTNSEADRQVYFDAVSKWFQDRHYRRMDAERALSSQPVADGWLPVTNGLNAIGFEIGGGYVLKLSYDNLRQFEAAHKSITSRLPASTGASE